MKITYAELQAEFPQVEFPYACLLQVQEWDDRRWAVIMRDDYSCSACGKKSDDRWHHGLHVHHCYYVVGMLPWQYPDGALTTLCADCHKTFHTTNSAPWYEMKDGELVAVEWEKCRRCN